MRTDSRSRDKRHILCQKGAVLASAMLLLFSTVTPVQALSTAEIPQDGSYHLADYASGTADIGSYQTFAQARRAFLQNQDQYDNLAIVKDGTVYQAEYAIALIKSDDACDYNVEFINDIDDTGNYTNGCYGKDAAYLDTSSDGSQAEFLISGVRGWTALENVTIVPIQNLPAALSVYSVSSGQLYHQIKTEMTDDEYAAAVQLGDAPAYLGEGVSYYSYDGHYFYSKDSLSQLLADEQNHVHDHSVNPQDPYYNYYQFVSHRTLSSISYQEMADYFSQDLGITDGIDQYNDNDKDSADDTLNRSQYAGEAAVFWQYQYQYGANAMMMIALSANESAYGRSSLSYTRNNLFGHAAYDTDAEKNASRYQSVDNSIYAHARYYISGSYCSPLKTQYHGGFFGNKSSGMNVSYASDPYWGEKAAQYYAKLDAALGGKDKNSYAIGIKTQEGAAAVYQYPETDAAVLYETSEMPDYAFVILRQQSNDAGDWYVIQSDATLNDKSLVDLSYDYRYADDIGYIRKDEVQLVLNPDTVHEESYVNVTFDAAGGSFPGSQSQISYELPAGAAAAAGAPVKDKALFTGWDQSLDAVTQDTVFTAQYQAVNAIAMKALPPQDYELNDRIILKGGIVTVMFADGTTEDLPLTTSMVSGYDLTQDGDQTVTVTVGGTTAAYSIHVSAEKDALRTEIKQSILDCLSQYQDAASLSQADADKVMALKTQIDDNMQPYLTQAQLRGFDRLVRLAIGSRIAYIVEKNSYDLEVSGLSLSLPLGDSLQKNQYLPDTYRVRIQNGADKTAEKKMKLQAAAMGADVKEAFRIDLTKNYVSFQSERPLVFTILKPYGYQANDDYTVLYYDSSDGDVQKCYTRQTSSAISFMAYGTGSYLVVANRSFNQYSGTDPTETVTAANSSFDMHLALVWCSAAAVGLIILLAVLHHANRRRKERIVAARRAKRQQEAARKMAEEKKEANSVDQHDSEA